MSEIDYTGGWPAKVKSWEIAEVEAINQLKLVVWMIVFGKNHAGEVWEKTMKFESFFLKKDGTQNKKTYNTLKTLGFRSQDIGDLISDDNALDKETIFTADVEGQDSDDGKTYWHIEWINGDVESKGAIKDKTTLKGHNLAKLNSFLGAPKPVKNHAPTFDENEDIPF